MKRLTQIEQATHILRRDGRVYVGYNEGVEHGSRTIISLFTLRALERRGIAKIIDPRPAAYIHAVPKPQTGVEEGLAAKAHGKIDGLDWRRRHPDPDVAPSEQVIKNHFSLMWEQRQLGTAPDRSIVWPVYQRAFLDGAGVTPTQPSRAEDGAALALVPATDAPELRPRARAARPGTRQRA